MFAAVFFSKDGLTCAREEDKEAGGGRIWLGAGVSAATSSIYLRYEPLSTFPFFRSFIR